MEPGEATEFVSHALPKKVCLPTKTMIMNFKMAAAEHDTKQRPL